MRKRREIRSNRSIFNRFLPSSIVNYTRRGLLTAAGVGALSGCLRLTNDSSTISGTETGTSTEATITNEPVELLASSLNDLGQDTTVMIADISNVDSQSYSPQLSTVTPSRLYFQDTTSQYFGMAAVSRETELLDWRRTDLDSRAHPLAFPSNSAVLPDGGASRVFDAATGEVLWDGLTGTYRLTTETELWMYNSEYPGRFQAYDFSTGERIQSVTTTPYDNYGDGDAIDAEHGFLYTQTVAGSFVLPVPGPSGNDIYRYERTVGVSDKRLERLSDGQDNPETMRLLPDESGGFEVTNVAVTGDIVVFAGSKLITVRRDEIRDGEPLVTKDIGVNSIWTDENRLFIFTGDRLAAIDGMDGTTVWSISGLDRVTPFGDYVLCATDTGQESNPPVRRVVDLETGRELGTLELSFTAGGNEHTHASPEPILTTDSSLVVYDSSVVSVFTWPKLTER